MKTNIHLYEKGDRAPPVEECDRLFALSRAPPNGQKTSLHAAATHSQRTSNAIKAQPLRISETLTSKGFHMNHTHQDAPIRIEPRTIDAPSTQSRTYTTQQLAEEFEVKTTTIGSWSSRWLTQVAPEALLKQGKGIYTELARVLLQEFVAVDDRERPAWVADAKQRYAAEWGSAGVIDCEVMPDNVGGTLALLQTNLDMTNHRLASGLAEVSDFIEQINAVEANCSDAEIQSWQAAGALKAVAQFKTEETARAQTLNALRQQRMGGDQA